MVDRFFVPSYNQIAHGLAPDIGLGSPQSVAALGRGRFALKGQDTVLEESVDVPGVLTTISGRQVSVVSPIPDMIDIRDIARALSNLCRYVGHVLPRKFYSVAEHCFLVSLLCGDDPAVALWALLHDGPEYVLGDLSSPVKHLGDMSAYRVLEKRVMAAICGRFNLPLREPPIVKQMDMAIRTKERIVLRGRTPRAGDPTLPITIHCWSPERAETMFLQQFHALMTACNREGTNEDAKLSTVS